LARAFNINSLRRYYEPDFLKTENLKKNIVQEALKGVKAKDETSVPRDKKEGIDSISHMREQASDQQK
jgi:hypothetical protein